MFKRFTAILLLVALISSNCSRFFVAAGFELNHKYITENLCINKNRPWLHCNGKCYFMKKVKEAQENEKKQQREDQKSRYQEALPVVQNTSGMLFAKNILAINYPRIATPKPITRVYSILLPPKIA